MVGVKVNFLVNNEAAILYSRTYFKGQMPSIEVDSIFSQIETSPALIDSIINYAINNEMTPGAQILVAKDSKIIYEKSFGKLRYNENSIINDETIYDLASLTKILVTTPILMNLIDIISLIICL